MGIDTHGPRPPPIVDTGSYVGYTEELDAENPAWSRVDANQSEGQHQRNMHFLTRLTVHLYLYQ